MSPPTSLDHVWEATFYALHALDAELCGDTQSMPQRLVSQRVRFALHPGTTRVVPVCTRADRQAAFSVDRSLRAQMPGIRFHTACRSTCFPSSLRPTLTSVQQSVLPRPISPRELTGAAKASTSSHLAKCIFAEKPMQMVHAAKKVASV